jgi:hypothetical protein
MILNILLTFILFFEIRFMEIYFIEFSDSFQHQLLLTKILKCACVQTKLSAHFLTIQN